jgi:large subunit ribosomal protein L10
MALTKKEKAKLIEIYKDLLEKSKNVVVMKQSGVPVNEMNRVRMDVYDSGWKMQVVKKRLFLRALKEIGYEDVDLKKFDGSIVVLYSIDDEFKPLKAVNKIVKQWKKEKLPYQLEYLWWMYDRKWKDSEYVKDIAELPTKDELIAKFAFLIKYPVQAFVMDLKQIVEKKVSDGSES